MCGIVGVLGNFSAAHGRELVQKMNEAIRHRGPDSDGVWSRDGFAFAMRRLSIIDLKTGSQPIWTEDGVGIVYNGEIYNYRALRSELEKSGARFKTETDTEVVLNLYHAAGIEGLSRLEGMFAFAIFDPRRKKVFIARDRIGIKPLYWAEHEGSFWFASEIKAILAGLNSRPPIDHESIHHYLTFRYVPSPKTIWQGVQKLEPGHILTYDLEARNWKIERYWECRFASEPVDRSRDYVHEFEDLFLDSVEKHLVASDVPVGVMLSGGLDSSAVAAAAIELGHRNFHTFTVGFKEGGEFSELSHARDLSRHIGSTHHEIEIDRSDFMNFLPEFVRFSDEPLADLASIPLYYVSKLARENVKVVLTGEGSDELLAGYNMERLALKLDLLRISGGNWREAFRGRLTHMTKYWTEREKEALWSAETRMPSSDDLLRSWYADAKSSHPLDQLQQVYCHSWLVEDLLMKADKMSMANSLELRVPFLDHRIIEWAQRLPIAWKVGSFPRYTSKRILREFAKKRVPASIINRPKQGFPVPAYRWLTAEDTRVESGKWAENLLLHESRFIGTLFDLSRLRPMLAAARKGDGHSAHKIWIMIILEFWGREWAS